MNIADLVAEHGKEKITITLKAREILHHHLGGHSVSDIEVDSEFYIVEDRYKVEEGYKIGLSPVHVDRFHSETFYQMDFNSMVKEGKIRVSVKLDDNA